MVSHTKLYVCRSVPEMEIDSIEFGLLPPKVMAKIASVEVTTPKSSETYESGPKGSVMDPRMGPANPEERCPVCGKKITEGCLGHFGIIRLPEPVINPLFRDEVINTVNSVGRKCGKIIAFPRARVALYKNKLREAQYKLRELEEKFYKGKISYEEFRKEYEKLHTEIEEIENKIIEAVREARERYIEKAKKYIETRGSAPVKYIRELKKQREKYIEIMTPMIECEKCGRRFYRMGHKTSKNIVYCPFHDKKEEGAIMILASNVKFGVRCPYCDELISVYKVETPRDKISEVVKKKILVKPYIKASKSKSKSKKRIESVIVEESDGESMDVNEILSILERIPDEDALVLGRHPKNSRPERAILRALIVPPNQVRPNTILQHGQYAKHSRTELYTEVVQAANQLRSAGESPAHTIKTMYDSLVFYIRRLFGVGVQKYKQDRQRKSLIESLRSKKGMFRRYMTGKRVDFSARSVISPDPSLSINEVGVPIEVARVLTVQEVMTEYNKDKIMRYIENGPEKYPGAKSIIFVDKNREVEHYDLSVASVEAVKRYIEESEDKHVIIERHMVDGDPVLYNRQPSLHRMSMMAFKARVLPYRTFRMNLAVCPPFNADFDGDEMNLHQLQLPEARVEALLLMLAEKNIMSPRYGAPIIGGNEDHITATTMVTYAGSIVPKHIARHLLGFAGYDAEFPSDELIQTRRLMSLLIPRKIHMRNRSRLCDAVYRHECPYYQALGRCPVEAAKRGEREAIERLIDEKIEELEKEGGSEKLIKALEDLRKQSERRCPFDVYMEIKGGEILSGLLDKFAVGAEKEFTIIHHIIRRYSLSEAGKFIDRAFRLALKFLTYHGFTVSAKDFDIPEEAFQIIKRIFDEYNAKIDKLYEDYREGRLEPEIGLTVEDTFKVRLRKLLDDLRDAAAKALIKYIINKGRVFENNVLIMTGTKARGDITQFAEMMVTVGAMTVRGQFISRGFIGRTLSHFKPGLLEPKAMGFVKSSFRLGMDPIEYFFQAAAGRDGLTDTATKTSESGYLQRKMIHNLEDIIVEYDGTVRTLYGDIIQFKYGEDGLDVSKTDYGTINVEKIIEEVIDDVESGIFIGFLKKRAEVRGYGGGS